MPNLWRRHLRAVAICLQAAALAGCGRGEAAAVVSRADVVLTPELDLVADVVPRNTTLGVMEGQDWFLMNDSLLFNGRLIDPTTTLIKYTYYGDADFNGQVNFDDYSRTDLGFNQSRTGWLNGDYDGNGLVNFDDYSLIDLAFNTQGAVL